MAKFKLNANSTVDMLTKDELRGELNTTVREFYEERARGLSIARDSSTVTVADTGLTFPATGKTIGPKPGFAWALQRLSVFNLASNDTLLVYRNSANPDNFLFQVTFANPTYHPGSKGCILRGPDKIIVTGASLTATGDVTINVEALECADLDLYKLI